MASRNRDLSSRFMGFLQRLSPATIAASRSLNAFSLVRWQSERDGRLRKQLSALAAEQGD